MTPNTRLTLAAQLLLVTGLGCAGGGGVIVPLATFGRATASPHPTFCGDTASSDSTVYDTTQVTQRPILYQAHPLRYPATARARGVQGRVLLAVTINPDGRAAAQSIQMISSPDSELTAAAVEWIRGARFEPVCVDAKAVRVRVAVPVDFKQG
jgi:TonB family protein